MDDTGSEDLPPHSRLSAGCRLCYEGAKLVLFLTGLCQRDCWYCPLSKERKNRDVIYANEHRITSPDEMILVARKMSALGTGITGGEPFLNPDRLSAYAGRLKHEFGKEHQIHIYTGMAVDPEVIHSMRGLIDEMRFNPPEELWEILKDTPYYISILAAKDAGMDVGIEVPSLAGINSIKKVLQDINFLNINELEWGDSNADAMRSRGHIFRGELSNAVDGGYEDAMEIISEPKVHWCSSSFKDSVQLRMRLKRIADNTAREFDEISEDGTVIYGVLECDMDNITIPEDYDDNMYERFQDRIETGWWMLEELSGKVSGKAYVIERYPDNGIILEVTPI